jgi:hypothetical protein
MKKPEPVPVEMWMRHSDGIVTHHRIESSQTMCFCKLWETIKNRFVVQDAPEYLKGKD